MKILVSGDWHYGRRVGGVDMSRDIDEMVRVFVDASREADLAVLTGDLLDSNRPDIRMLDLLIHRLSELQCRCVVMPGNHDFETTKLIYSVSMLAGLQIEVLTLPAFKKIDDKHLAFLGYLSDSVSMNVYGKTAQFVIDGMVGDLVKGEFVDLFGEPIDKIDGVFCHLDFDGCYGEPNGPELRGKRLSVSKDALHKLPCNVVCGHYHGKSVVGRNIFFHGSVASFDRSDNGIDKFYIQMEV